MILRTWLLTGLVWLGAVLLPGCVAVSPVDPTLNPHDHIPDLPRVEAREPDSSYHQQPTPPEAPATRGKTPDSDEPPYLQKGSTPPGLPGSPVQPAPVESLPEPKRVTPAPQEVKKSEPREEPLVVALRAYLQKRPADALEALHNYAKANQDMLLVTLPFIARLTEGNIEKVPPREAAELADLLQAVEDRLRQRAALRIEKILFCRKIDDFGVYVPRESINGIATFEGGVKERDQVGELIQVYAELRNVSARQQGDRYETRLVGTVELLDFEGRSAYRRDFAPPPHIGQSPRRDFFVKCSFSVPRMVPPGRYTLRGRGAGRDGPAERSLGLHEAPPPHRIARQTLDLQVTEPRANRVVRR